MTIIPAGFIKGLHVWRQEFYWAVADAGQAQFDWISSALGPLGVGNIEMWTNLQDRYHIQRIDSLYAIACRYVVANRHYHSSTLIAQQSHSHMHLVLTCVHYHH